MIPVKKIGPRIVLALPENHSSKFKDKVLENIDLDSLRCDKGYENSYWIYGYSFGKRQSDGCF